MNFGEQIQAYVNRKKRAMNAVVSVSLHELNSKIIHRTPVDTGRLRGNWQATLDAPSTKSLWTTDKDGDETEFAAALVAAKAPGRVYYFVNNVTYARRIEYLRGSPRKARDGMLRISLVEFPAIWNNAIAANR